MSSNHKKVVHVDVKTVNSDGTHQPEYTIGQSNTLGDPFTPKHFNYSAHLNEQVKTALGPDSGDVTIEVWRHGDAAKGSRRERLAARGLALFILLGSFLVAGISLASSALSGVLEAAVPGAIYSTIGVNAAFAAGILWYRGSKHGLAFEMPFSWTIRKLGPVVAILAASLAQLLWGEPIAEWFGTVFAGWREAAAALKIGWAGLGLVATIVVGFWSGRRTTWWWTMLARVQREVEGARTFVDGLHGRSKA